MCSCQTVVKLITSNNMYCLSRFCCLCFSNDVKLNYLNNKSFVDMVTILIPELEFLEINDFLLICEECTDRVNDLHAFRRSCVGNILLLVGYVKQLSSFGDGIGDIRINVMENYKSDDVNVTVKEEEVEQVIEVDPLWISEDSKDVKTEGCDEYADSTIPPENESSQEYETSRSSSENSSEDILEDPLRIHNSGIKVEPLDNFPAMDENEKSENSAEPTESHSQDLLGDEDVTSIKCNLCESSFPSLNEWKQHTLTHTRTNPYKCQSCGKKISKPGPSKLYKCETCENPQSVPKEIPQKSYKCSTCGKSFPLSGSLEKHNLIHIGQAPYTCETCGQTFIFFSQWKQHSLVHTGEKPHKCRTCGKCFSNSGHLRQHGRTHTGEKPYYCEVCGKHFARLYALKTHQLIHTGEKRHKCEMCDKAFSEIRSLKRHRLKHSEVSPDVVKEENSSSS